MTRAFERKRTQNNLHMFCLPGTNPINAAAALAGVRQSIGRSPQVSAPQGKILHSTLALAVYDAGHLVLGR